MRRAAPYAELERADFDAVVELVSEGITTGRGKRMAYVHRDRRQRRAAAPARRAPGRAHERRGHRRGGRLPGDRRARRHPGGHGERGLRHRVDGGRRLPARDALVADPAGHPGRGPGDRRRGRAPHHPVLGGRGPEPDRRAVRGGLARCGAAVGELLTGDAAEADAGRERRRGRSRRRAPTSSEACGLDADAAAPTGRSTWRPRLGELGVLPTADDIVFERFFDEAGGMQMVVHAPSAAGSTGASAWRCASASAPPSTSSSRRRPTTTPWCCRSGPSTASPSTARPGCCARRRPQAALRQAVLASPMFTVAVALEPEPLPGRAALPGRARRTRSPSSAWRPTT